MSAGLYLNRNTVNGSMSTAEIATLIMYVIWYPNIWMNWVNRGANTNAPKPEHAAAMPRYLPETLLSNQLLMRVGGISAPTHASAAPSTEPQTQYQVTLPPNANISCATSTMMAAEVLTTLKFLVLTSLPHTCIERKPTMLKSVIHSIQSPAPHPSALITGSKYTATVLRMAPYEPAHRQQHPMKITNA